MKSNDSVLELANLRGRELQASEPRAVSARYDRRTGRVVVHLPPSLPFARAAVFFALLVDWPPMVR